MKILDYTVCDDIRSEINNKFTIVGAYNDRVEFLVRDGSEIKFPISLPLSFYIRVLPEGIKGTTDIQIDFYIEKKHIHSNRLKLLSPNHDSVRPLVLPIVNRGFVLHKGQMHFVVTFYKNEEIIAKSEPSFPFDITVNKQS